MYQITFSHQSMGELNKLDKATQMELVEKFSSITLDRLQKPSKELGQLHRDGKVFYRLRAGDFRIYFELIDDTLYSHYILQKDTWSDFAFRCKLPVNDDSLVEQHSSFWKFLDNLGK